MEVERNLASIGPTGSLGKRRSSSKFEVCKTGDKSINTELKIESFSFTAAESTYCYRMADLAMNMLIVFPLSIGFWRGVWQLMDYYSREWGAGPWLSVVLGYFIPFGMYWYQEPLKRSVVPGRMNFVPFYIISRSLLLIHSFGSVNQWRGLWQFLDNETGTEADSNFISLMCGIFFNLILRTFSNVLAPPLLCFVDEASTIHDCSLRFNTPPEQKCRYFWDCAFSVFVIPSLTVLCWRGVWNLADLYVYHEDPVWSAWSSLIFGYTLSIMVCLAQPLILEYVCRLKGLVRLAVVDMTYMVGFIGCVFAWRGVWNSYNIYIIFETPMLSEWVTTIIGIIGTVFFGCVSTVVVKGIAVDGDLCQNEGAAWLIPYVSHLRQRNFETPFPEPWIFRYFFTKQKMNCEKVKVSHHRTRPNNLTIRESQPLKKKSNVPNSHGKQSEDSQSQITNPPLKIRFAHMDIPHIDSSEDDLEAKQDLADSESESHHLDSLHQVVTIQTRQN